MKTTMFGLTSLMAASSRAPRRFATGAVPGVCAGVFATLDAARHRLNMPGAFLVGVAAVRHCQGIGAGMAEARAAGYRLRKTPI